MHTHLCTSRSVSTLRHRHGDAHAETIPRCRRHDSVRADLSLPPTRLPVACSACRNEISAQKHPMLRGVYVMYSSGMA